MKLLVDEPGSKQAELVWDTSDVVASAALVIVEARAALAAAECGGRIGAAQHRTGKDELAALVAELAIVEIAEEVIALAADLAEEDTLRGYDAVHLASAITVGANVLTSADSDLCQAAAERGLHVANPLDP